MVSNSKVVAELLLSLAGTGYSTKRLVHSVLTADEQFQRGVLMGGSVAMGAQLSAGWF